MSVISPEIQDFTVLLDLDWTLYDTSAFKHDLWQVVAEATGRPVEAIDRESNNFYLDQTLGGYTFEDHMASYGLDSGLMLTKLDKLLQDNDYSYPDSSTFIRDLKAAGFDPSILTFGETRYQTAKVTSHLGKLAAEADLEFDVVQERKGIYIARTYPTARGVLVDDVSDQKLPEGFTEIHLDRDRKLSAPQAKDGGFVVSDLAQAFEVIQTLAA